MVDDRLLFFINDSPENPDNIYSKPRLVNWKKSLSQVVIVSQDGDIIRKLNSDIPGNLSNNAFFNLLPGNRVLTRYATFKKYDKPTYQILDLNQILAE